VSTKSGQAHPEQSRVTAIETDSQHVFALAIDAQNTSLWRIAREGVVERLDPPIVPSRGIRAGHRTIAVSDGTMLSFSRDGGRTWSPPTDLRGEALLGIDFEGRPVVASPGTVPHVLGLAPTSRRQLFVRHVVRTEGTIYIATNDGIWRSQDPFHHAQQVPISAIRDADFVSVAALQNVVAAVTQTGQVALSTDHGAHWEVAQPVPHAGSVVLVPGRILLAAFGGVFEHREGRWTRISDQRITCQRACPIATTTGLVAVQDEHVIVSSDGKDWRPLSMRAEPGYGARILGTDHDAQWFVSLPGTRLQQFVTLNGGGVFFALPPDIAFSAFAANGSSWLATGSLVGRSQLFASRDYGRSWTAHFAPVSPIGVLVLNDDRVIAYGEDRVVLGRLGKHDRPACQPGYENHTDGCTFRQCPTDFAWRERVGCVPVVSTHSTTPSGGAAPPKVPAADKPRQPAIAPPRDSPETWPPGTRCTCQLGRTYRGMIQCVASSKTVEVSVTCNEHTTPSGVVCRRTCPSYAAVCPTLRDPGPSCAGWP